MLFLLPFQFRGPLLQIHRSRQGFSLPPFTGKTQICLTDDRIDLSCVNPSHCKAGCAIPWHVTRIVCKILGVWVTDTSTTCFMICLVETCFRIVSRLYFYLIFTKKVMFQRIYFINAFQIDLIYPCSFLWNTITFVDSVCIQLVNRCNSLVNQKSHHEITPNRSEQNENTQYLYQ